MDYVDITRLIINAGRRPKDYLRTKRSQSEIQRISTELGISKESLIVTTRGKNAETRVHPKLVDDITSWCGIRTQNLIDNISRTEIPDDTNSNTDDNAEKLNIVDIADNIVVDSIKSPIIVSHTNIINSRDPQVYFGIPGGSWLWLRSLRDGSSRILQKNELVLKLGMTIADDRPDKHKNLFGSFVVLDSVLTGCCSIVEQQLKYYLKNDGRLFKGLNSAKKTVDTELVIVSSQEQYIDIVKKAVSLAESYECTRSTEVRDLTEKIRLQNAEYVQKEQELRLRQKALEIEKANLELCRVQSESLNRKIAENEYGPRFLSTWDVLEFLRIEQATKDQLFRAEIFMNDIEKAFRWFTQYKYAIAPTDVLAWIAKAKVPSTCRNLTIGYDALVHCARVVVMMKEDLGEVEVTRIQKLVREAKSKYAKATFDKQKEKKKALAVLPYDKHGRIEHIENKEVVGRFAETMVKRMGWKDLIDIAKNPMASLIKTLDDFKDAAISTRNKHHTALLSIVKDDLMKSFGETAIGEEAYAAAVIEIETHQICIRKMFNDDNKKRKQ